MPNSTVAVLVPGSDGSPLVGNQEVREAGQKLSVPIVAIGGITPDNAAELIAQGADAVAVINALFGAPDIRAVAKKFSRLFRARRASPLQNPRVTT